MGLKEGRKRSFVRVFGKMMWVCLLNSYMLEFALVSIYFKQNEYNVIVYIIYLLKVQKITKFSVVLVFIRYLLFLFLLHMKKISLLENFLKFCGIKEILPHKIFLM